jgi:hypothetical protein
MQDSESMRPSVEPTMKSGHILPAENLGLKRAYAILERYTNKDTTETLREILDRDIVIEDGVIEPDGQA